MTDGIIQKVFSKYKLQSNEFESEIIRNIVNKFTVHMQLIEQELIEEIEKNAMGRYADYITIKHLIGDNQE